MESRFQERQILAFWVINFYRSQMQGIFICVNISRGYDEIMGFFVQNRNRDLK